MLALAVEHVNRLKPRFVVVSGDLINGFPGKPKVSDQVEAFEGALARLDPSIPLVLEPGNHDLGQRPTEAAVRAYQERFGDDYLRFWVGGVLFVSLNSQVVKAGDGVAARRAAHTSWAAEAFETRAERVVVLSHICPFVGVPDEAEGRGPRVRGAGPEGVDGPKGLPGVQGRVMRRRQSRRRATTTSRCRRRRR